MTKKEALIGYRVLQLLFNMACSEDVIQEAANDRGEVEFKVSRNVFIFH